MLLYWFYRTASAAYSVVDSVTLLMIPPKAV